MLRPHPAVAVTLAAFVTGAHGQTVCFTKLADHETINPYGARPAIDRGLVAFLGRDDASGVSGIFRMPADGSAPPTVIADEATIAPNQADTFFTAFWNPDIYDGQVVFAARYDGQGIDGIYLGDGGSVITLVDSPADNQDAIGVEGVTWETNGGSFSTPWFKPFDGDAFPIATLYDPMPGGGTFVDIDPHPPTIDGGLIGLAAYVTHDTGVDGGVYLYDIAGDELNLVTNWTVQMPGREEHFDYFSAVDCDGQTVALVGKSGYLGFGGHQGLYTAPAASAREEVAPLTLVAEIGSPAPGGGTFDSFGNVAIDGDVLVFEAFFGHPAAPSGMALFARIGDGELFRVATLGDEIAGVTPQTLDFNFRGLDGDTIVFRGSLGPPPNGGPYLNALFTATLHPEDGVECPDPGDPGPGGSNDCREWMAADAPSGDTGVRDVAVLGMDDVWVAGGSGFTSHFDGQSWTNHLAPQVDGKPVALENIDGGADGAVWAVGNHQGASPDEVFAAAMRWDGAQWTHVPLPQPDPEQNWLMGVEVIADDDVWAVGWTGFKRYWMVHWDGRRWSEIALPDPPTTLDELQGISGTGPDDIWAAGSVGGTGYEYQATILHYDGTSWTEVPDVPQPLSNPSLYDIEAIAPDNVWAVGSRFVSGLGHQTLVMRYDGTTWRPVLSPNPGAGWNFLFGVAGSDAEHVYATGYHYYGAVSEPIALTWNAETGLLTGHDLEMVGYSTTAWAAGALPNGEGLAVGTLGYYGLPPDVYVTRFAKPAGPADVNCDDVVDVDDLLEVVIGWGPCDTTDPRDVDGSGEIGVDDMIYVLLSWTG